VKVSILGIAWYRREDYPILLNLFSDRAILPATYDDWFKRAENLMDQLKTSGFAFQRVYIDPQTFPAWCAARGLDVNAEARSRFASESVAGINQGPIKRKK
jgi:hypothetical protein